jgi:hypothetical protein
MYVVYHILNHNVVRRVYVCICHAGIEVPFGGSLCCVFWELKLIALFLIIIIAVGSSVLDYRRWMKLKIS